MGVLCSPAMEVWPILAASERALSRNAVPGAKREWRRAGTARSSFWATCSIGLSVTQYLLEVLDMWDADGRDAHFVGLPPRAACRAEENMDWPNSGIARSSSLFLLHHTPFCQHHAPWHPPVLVTVTDAYSPHRIQSPSSARFRTSLLNTPSINMPVAINESVAASSAPLKAWKEVPMSAPVATIRNRE